MRSGQIGLDLFDDEFIQDPYPLYERMHANGAVHPIGESGFYAVSAWDAVNDVIARPTDFSSNLTSTMTYQDGNVGSFVMGEPDGDIQALATADDPTHAVHRKLLLPQLAARRIDALESYIDETADRLWDEGVTGGEIEWMSAMANRLPMMVVTRLIGVPDVDVQQLVRWGYASTQVVEGLVGPDELTAAGIAVIELAGYITEHFQRAAGDPKDDLVSVLGTECASGRLANLTAMNMMITLFSTGGESTASLIGQRRTFWQADPTCRRRYAKTPVC